MNEGNLPWNGREERLWDLLADRAVAGLNESEAQELEQLLAEFPEVDADALDRVAAEMDLALAPVASEPLPAALAAKIAQARAGELASKHDDHRETKPSPVRSESMSAGQRWAGWLLIAAALFVAVRVWRTEPQPKTVIPLAMAREELLRDAKDTVKLDWTATEDPAAKGAAGDLVWSNARQEGFMRFRGLAANDPSKQQYQLWIFDTAQDERYPIDGGVFDVDPSTGDVLVRIVPKLRVTKPTLFAVTVEKPGGVVVSSRQRLPLLAKVPQS